MLDTSLLALAQWCTEAAVELESAKITSQDVLKALVARLLTDETLARKIRADLQEVVESARQEKTRRRRG